MPITRKYRRIADHLQIVGVRDGAGTEQTLHTTDEHPFFVPGQRWTKSKALEAGDHLTGPMDIGSSVTSNARQSHPAGVVVYNMEIGGTHTYFVRAEDSDAEPVWVHNACIHDPKTGKFVKDPNAPDVVFTRETEYPSALRTTTIQKLRAKYADPDTGMIRDASGRVIPESQLTWDHITPVVEHWNTVGRYASRATRNDWFNNLDNLRPMTRSANSSLGGKLGASGTRYNQETGAGYSS